MENTLFYHIWMSYTHSGSALAVEVIDDMEVQSCLEMCNDAMTRLMEIKTKLLNANHKLQSPDMQRGVLPQAEERKESLSLEAHSCEAETQRLIKEFRKQPIKIVSRGDYTDILESIIQLGEKAKRTFPNLNRDAESFFVKAEENKTHFGQTESGIGRIPPPSPTILERVSEMRSRIEELLHQRGDGNPPHDRPGK